MQWVRENADADVVVATISVRDPALARLARWTGGDLAVPVEIELLDCEGPFGARLPLIDGRGRANEGDAMVASAGREAVGVDVSGIDEVTLRPEILVLQCRMHVGQHVPVHHWRSRGFGMGDQIGLSTLTSLRAVDLVADPRRLTCLGIVDVEIMRRGHHPGRRWIAFHFGASA